MTTEVLARNPGAFPQGLGDDPVSATDSKIYSLAIDLLKICSGFLLGVGFSCLLSSRTAQIYSIAASFFGSFLGSLAGCALLYCLFSKMATRPQSEPASPPSLDLEPQDIGQPAAAQRTLEIPPCPEEYKEKIRRLIDSFISIKPADLYSRKAELQTLGIDIGQHVNHFRFLLFIYNTPDLKSKMEEIFKERSGWAEPLNMTKFKLIRSELIAGIRIRMLEDENRDSYLHAFARELGLDEELVRRSIRWCARKKDFEPFVRDLFAKDGAPLRRRSPA
ncbi:MAG: hypothetical protein A3E80_00310 [Chlamydiae bacterium RIFCSPHIGHO2_12_FULL_49_9]|nr:MAG: hypothetical protein A3E80_00310 [Chlamydiae bacterium RIFCSPHIGHO2_12_FULL_49_9]